jgi:tetratricopeptide (TPR) repeat protein
MPPRTNLPDDEVVRATLPDGALAPLLGVLQRGRAHGWLRLTGMEVRGGIPSVIRIALRLQDARVVAVEATDDPLRPLPPGTDVAERATAAIGRVLACRDAVQSWEPFPDEGPSDPAAPLLAAVTLRAMERLPDAAAVQTALGPADRALSPCSPAQAALAALTSTQRILMTRVRADVTAAALIESGDGDATARDLLALLCAGAVEWVRPPTAADEPAAPSPKETAPEPPRPRTGASQAYRDLDRRPGPPSPAPMPPAAAPASAPRVFDRAARRREIEEAHAALRGATHFAVLGLGPAASLDEIRQAFARMARRFHPDAERDPALADLHQKLTDLFVAVNGAYGVLKDPVARARYESGLAARVAAQSAAGAHRAATRWAGNPADEPVEARILRAEEALSAGQPWETIALMQETIPAATGASKLRAQVLLAAGYADRERPREAEKILLDVLQADPRFLPACLSLARIYRDQGMVRRAQGLYERALEVDPRHPEARRALAALGTEPPDPGGGGGSLRSRPRDRS